MSHVAKAWTMYQGIKLLKEVKFGKAIIEGDSLNSINILKRNQELSYDLVKHFDEIKP